MKWGENMRVGEREEGRKRRGKGEEGREGKGQAARVDSAHGFQVPVPGAYEGQGCSSPGAEGGPDRAASTVS